MTRLSLSAQHPRRTGFFLRLAALALLVPAALSAQVQHPVVRTLSLEEAISLARENNPDFLAQLNDVHLARWDVRSAYGNLLPSASASHSFGYTAAGPLRFGSEVFGVRPDYYSSGYSLGLAYDLNGARLLQPAAARAQVRATEERVTGVEANLVAQVTQQYLAVLQAQEGVSVAEREVARTEEHVRLAEARRQVGAGTSLDVKRAEVQQGQAEIRLLQTRTRFATETLALGRLLGTPLQPGVELVSQFALIEPRWQSEELYALALNNNPALQAARAATDAAQARLQAARSSYLPSLRFSLSWTGSAFRAGNIDPLVQGDLDQIGRSYPACVDQNEIRQRVGMGPVNCPNPTDPAVIAGIRERRLAENSGFPFDYERQPLNAGLTLSLPLFTGLSRQQQVEETRVAAQDARYQVRAEELRLQVEVGTALLNVQTAYRAAELQARVREMAEEELRLAAERFRAGLASSLEVTDAQTRLAETEQAEIEAVYTFHQSLAALEALVGQPLR